MDLKNCAKKFKLLLNYIFEEKIVLQENQVEKLLKLLQDPGQHKTGKRLLDTPCFSNLISDYLKNFNDVNTSVKGFLIELITILFKNELQFTKMQMLGYGGLYLSQLCIFDERNNVPPVNIHLAYIKLATVEISHCSGLKTIVKHKGWKNILYANIHLRPKKVSEAAYNFISNLVWRLHEHKAEEELIEVLGYIVEPILTSGYFHVPLLDNESDIELSNQIYPYLSALLAIMVEANNQSHDNKVMPLLKEYFLIDIRLYDILNSTKRPTLLKLLNSCLFRYCFGVLRHLLYEKKTDEFCNTMAAFHRNYIVHAVQKRDPVALIDFVIQSSLIWSRFEKANAHEFDFPLMFERNGQKYDFSLQILVNLLMPLLKHYAMTRNLNFAQMTDIIEHFISTFGRTVTDYIISCCYLFANFLEEGGSNYRKIVAIHTLKEIQRLKGHITKSQAGPIFQSLYYVIQMFIETEEESAIEENEIDQNDLTLLWHSLEGMKMLLKGHFIPWYENLEVISVQADLLHLLKQNFLTTKHIVQVLDVVNICVSKFLSPNMSLLVESKNTQSNTLSEIGSMIKLYMQHSDWEVRDSALNLLNSCTEICFIKYEPLRKVIQENNLVVLAAKTGINDPEFYPQCAALNCLTKATKIDCIWQEVLKDNPQIILQLINIVKAHGEGMVRKEALNVLTAVYTNQKVTPSLLNKLYDVMLTAALDDFHWEVQLAALNFWKEAIQAQLTYSGMLDGKFPPVTFSKERRRIVVLNKAEIERQLDGIMTHLSGIGCLTVLEECMTEMQNIEVIELAYSIAKELIEILDNYNFEKVTSNVKIETDYDEYLYRINSYMDEDNNMPINLSRPNLEERDKVIDSILSENQSELIYKLHDNYAQRTLVEMDIEYTYKPRRNLIGANEFLEIFRNNDYSVLIADKKISYSDDVNTLGEILDEILSMYVP